MTLYAARAKMKPSGNQVRLKRRVFRIDPTARGSSLPIRRISATLGSKLAICLFVARAIAEGAGCGSTALFIMTSRAAW